MCLMCELYFAASDIEFNLYFVVLLSQALEEESTSHLKIVSGISHALPAPSALLPWWALAFSLMVTGSCAVTVTAIYRAVVFFTIFSTSLNLVFALCHFFSRPPSHRLINAASQVIFI